jgi:TIR domain-containing protein
MKVFISWSGEPSRTVALALRDWIPTVIQTVRPWMSQSDIEAGTRWSPEIAQELEASQFGIICLTNNNQSAPWIMFEAGALAKTIPNTIVIPYLINLAPTDVSNGPLAQFQAKQADEDGTWSVISAINRMGENPLPDNHLRKTFDRWWPDLKQILDTLPSAAVLDKPTRSTDDKLTEVLELVRELSRRELPEPDQDVRSIPNVESTRETVTVMGATFPLSESYLSPSAVKQVIYRLKQDKALDRKINDTYSLKRSNSLWQYIGEKVPYLTEEAHQKVYDELRRYFERKYRFTGDALNAQPESNNPPGMP